MKLRSSTVVLVVNFLVELFNYSQKRYITNFATLTVRLSVLCVQGVTFLSYPLLGHLADVYLTRYRALKCGLIMYIIGQVATTAVILFDACVYLFSPKETKFFEYGGPPYVLGITGIAIIIGIGLFQANVTQFGLDQLLESPTAKLIEFIHWYYWTKKLGSLLLYYCTAIVAYFAEGCTIKLFDDSELVKRMLPAACLAISCTVAIATLVLFYVNKHHLYIQRAGLNPFKTVYKVLKYSWNHSIPERRSAFTYWEEDIPRRIDLGKNKYGGPFTNEEVEDTKTFLRILPLLLCLFGYHLAGDGYSAPEHLEKASCPSLLVLILTSNKKHFNQNGRDLGLVHLSKKYGNKILK